MFVLFRMREIDERLEREKEGRVQLAMKSSQQQQQQPSEDKWRRRQVSDMPRERERDRQPTNDDAKWRRSAPADEK